MLKSNGSSYFWKILWIVGLILLAKFNFSFEMQAKQSASESFHYLPVIWANAISSLLFGLYISLIFVKKWSFHLNPSLLWCVTIPSLFLSLVAPLFATLSSFKVLPDNIAGSSIFYWLINVTSSTNIFGIVAGLSIILSFFNDSQSK